MMLPLFANFSSTYRYLLSPEERLQKELSWELGDTIAYNEAIVSWNGRRPEKGSWLIYLSLCQEGEWSPWLKYAEWTPTTQKTFKSCPENSWAESYQDAANPKEGKCQALRVRVVGEEGADLRELDSLFACLSYTPDYHQKASPSELSPVLLPAAPLQSQMVLDHPRCKDMCSPTSTSTALNYLLGYQAIDPIRFASRSHDDEFDIYGNWILNTAEASHQLGGRYRVHVERMKDFDAVHAQLVSRNPVVVSVKGSIPGAPQPYNSGHLICLVGYDPREEKVYCVDPAFPDNESTFVGYALSEFLKAWGVRKNLAYIFEPAY
jgi:hypothetical protein